MALLLYLPAGMARLQCLCLSDRHSRSFKTSSEDDSYDSGLSVREEIRFRVSQLDEERRKTNMRVVKLRQKIESRRVGVNNIIASLGLDALINDTIKGSILLVAVLIQMVVPVIRGKLHKSGK